MVTYVFSKNGMGDYTAGTGMREDMLMMPFNAREYRAGIIESSDLLVVQRGAGANMSVDVAAGKILVANTSYSANTANSTKYWGVLVEGTTNLAISTNTSGSTRVDIVIAKVDTVPIPNSYATNVATVEIVEGTPGGGTPATPSNSYKLATITIPTGTTTSITTAMIADNRARAYVDGSKILVPNNSYIKATNSGGTDLNLIGFNSSNQLMLGDPSSSATEVHVDATIASVVRGLYFGADVNEPYIGSRTNHGLRIIVNSLKTAYFATDYALRLYSSDASGTYAAIGSDASDNLYLLPGGTGLVNVVGTDLALRAGKAIRVYSAGDSVYTLINTDSNDNLIFTPNANGDLIVFGKLPRRSHSTNTYSNDHIQRGWEYAQGDGTNELHVTCTLPVGFNAATVTVIPVLIGRRSTGSGAPSSEAGSVWSTLDTAGQETGVTLASLSVTATDVTAFYTTGESGGVTGAWANTKYYGVTFLFVGPL